MMAFPIYAKHLFDGFAENPKPVVQRTEMESGPAKQLLVSSRQMVERPVTYKLSSKADYQAFKAWVAGEAAYGNNWFDWTDPVDSTVKQARIVKGEISYTPLSKALTKWTAAFTLETWG